MNPGAQQLLDRLTDFATDVANWSPCLANRPAGRLIAAQIIRSSYSPSSNYGEAQRAESKRDFIHKVQICLKELTETLNWLTAARKLGYGGSRWRSLYNECDQLVAIFVTIVRNAKENPE